LVIDKSNFVLLGVVSAHLKALYAFELLSQLHELRLKHFAERLPLYSMVDNGFSFGVRGDLLVVDSYNYLVRFALIVGHGLTLGDRLLPLTNELLGGFDDLINGEVLLFYSDRVIHRTLLLRQGVVKYHSREILVIF